MSTVQAALGTITAADLSPTEHLLLKHFVEGAVDSEAAAEYLTSRVQSSRSSVEESLRHIKRDFRKLASRMTACDPIPRRVQGSLYLRDGHDFAMRRNPSHVSGSNVEPAYIVPPSMVRGLVSTEQTGSTSLLEAFLTSTNVSRLQNLFSKLDNSAAQLQNVLLLPPSARRAFRDGHVDIRTRTEMAGRSSPGDEDRFLEKCVYGVRRLYPEEPTDLYLGDGTPFQRIIQYFELCTPDAKALPLPSNFLLNVHFRFATALHLFSIEDKVARGWHKPLMGFSLPKSVRHGFTSLWLSLPHFFRVPCYMLLKMLGRWLYPHEADAWAQRLPFGLYLKQCTRASRNEPNVLRLLERHTSIPAPRLLDEFETNCVTNIIMTRLPGVPVDEVYHLMTYTERDQFARDLMNCVNQIRKIPNKMPYLICDSLGGPITDHRFRDEVAGPFNTEADFNDYLTAHLHAPFSEVAQEKNPPVRDHAQFPFTHSDLHPSNLLVEQGRLSGIVDWESAGFKPDYWEFTKCFYGIGAKSDLNDLYWRAFGREYESELEVERQLWYLTPF